MTDHRLEQVTQNLHDNTHTAHCKCGWSGAAPGLSAVIAAHREHFIAVTEGSAPKPDQFPIGSHVVYHGKSYSFPGEVVMRDDTGVVVKAFGDMDGNYAGMKHIYADGVLHTYTIGDGTAHHCPPLVIFSDDNPIAKMHQWVRLYGKRPAVKSARGMATIAKLLEELEALGAKQDAWEEREAQQLRAFKDKHTTALCYNTGLPCLAGCDHKNCAGFHTPLDKWPGVTDD